ncbi:twin-arginine translocation pathway signal protein [Burkholderia contaminans]|uniref:twin-arginine translocation pathway signal protein n=1 Tax=Burkholderia contaminans TaxID=488447 RepID=UPI003D669CC4
MRSIAPGATSPKVISRSSKILGLLLAVLATSTSTWITVVAGIERGGRINEQIAWAAVGVVLLLGAHLIPAVIRQSPPKVRIAAMTVWAVCMLSTGYGHATFFLTAQGHAGDVRAATVQRSLPAPQQQVPHGRTPAAVAADQARVKQALIAARATRCATSCRLLEARRESLSIQLAALDVEAEEARRNQAAADRVRASTEAVRLRVERARLDPVSARAADALGISRDSIDLAIAITFGGLLECVACLGWMLALASSATSIRNDARADANQTIELVGLAGQTATVATHSELLLGDQLTPADIAPTRDNDEASTFPPTPETDQDLVKITHAIALERLRPTVKEIREFLHCSQKRAMELRRQFLDDVCDASRSPAELAASAIDERRLTLVTSSARQVHAA